MQRKCVERTGSKERLQSGVDHAVSIDERLAGKSIGNNDQTKMALSTFWHSVHATFVDNLVMYRLEVGDYPLLYGCGSFHSSSLKECGNQRKLTPLWSACYPPILIYGNS